MVHTSTQIITTLNFKRQIERLCPLLRHGVFRTGPKLNLNTGFLLDQRQLRQCIFNQLAMGSYSTLSTQRRLQAGFRLTQYRCLRE